MLVFFSLVNSFCFIIFSKNGNGGEALFATRSRRFYSSSLEQRRVEEEDNRRFTSKRKLAIVLLRDEIVRVVQERATVHE